MPKISPTLNCQNKVNERKEKKLPIYNFGLGENPITQPQYYIDSVKKYAHIKNYTPPNGVSELNNIIKKKLSIKKYIISNVLVGNGLKELLYIAQLSFKGKIIHITPSWVSYKEQIDILNRQDDLIQICTTLDEDYKINPSKLDEILKQYESENKMILFNNPNNPTGVTHTPSEVKQIAEILNKYNCIVLADEIYFNINHYNMIESICNYIPHLTIRGSSVSKDLGCGGYRLGWLTYPKELDDLYYECLGNASSIYSCTSTPIQYATYEVLQDKTILQDHSFLLNKIFKEITNRVCLILDKSKLKYVKPTAAWYFFVNFDYYKDKLNINNSYDLSEYFLDKFGIVSVAGECFNSPGLNLRLSLVDININELDNYDIAFCHIIEGFNILVDHLNSI